MIGLYYTAIFILSFHVSRIF